MHLTTSSKKNHTTVQGIWAPEFCFLIILFPDYLLGNWNLEMMLSI